MWVYVYLLRTIFAMYACMNMRVCLAICTCMHVHGLYAFNYPSMVV